MADFSSIIQEVNTDINTNGANEITGAKLNKVLRDMIAAVNAAKQDPLTIDATPTEDSTNPVQSGGVYSALLGKATRFYTPDITDIPPTILNRLKVGDIVSYGNDATTSATVAVIDVQNAIIILVYNDGMNVVGFQYQNGICTDTVSFSLSGMANKVSGATNGHLAGLDTNGNLTDSGIAANEVATKADLVAKPITYSALKALRDGGNLVPGTWYRITDYHTTVLPLITDVRSADYQFDVIVRADDASHLNENGYAAHHEGDEYFAACKLEAWELQYRLDNENWSRVAGTFIEDDGDGYHMRKLGTVEVEGETYILWDASEFTEDYEITRAVSEDDEVGTELKGYDPETGEILDDGWSSSIASKFDVEGDGQGTILMLKDEYGNQCPYDFKSIQFKRWAVTDSQQGRDGLDGKYMGVLNNVPANISIEDEDDFIWAYTFSSDATGSEDQVDYSLDGTHWVYGNVLAMAPDAMNDLNDIVFYGEYNYGNRFGVNCYRNSFGNNCGGNSFGNGCQNNSFGNGCNNNSFGNSCFQNSFGNYFQNNSFGNSCTYNSFGNYCQTITVFDGVQNCSVTGGSQSAPVKNAQILNGTAGASAQNKLTIAFAANKAYTQVAAKTTAGALKIFNPADLA